MRSSASQAASLFGATLATCQSTDAVSMLSAIPQFIIAVTHCVTATLSKISSLLHVHTYFSVLKEAILEVSLGDAFKGVFDDR